MKDGKVSYCGMHMGVKKGKTFQALGNPNKKAMRKLQARQDQHKKDPVTATISPKQPGSMNKRRH